ncbi:MAG: hypothetical protein ACAH80_11590 [Alphaproteobacteria bacterium]
MKPEEREQLLDALIDLMVVMKLGGGRHDVAPYIGDDGAFGFYCGWKDEGATTAAVITILFERNGLAPGATRDADYLSYRNLDEGHEIQSSDVSRVVNDQDSGFRFECRAEMPLPQLLETLGEWTARARQMRRDDARFELSIIEKKAADRRRDRITEVFSAAHDEMFVSAYLIQRTEAWFDGATADVIPEPARWTPDSCTVITTDVSDSGFGADFDKQSNFKWDLSKVFNSSGAVGSHAEDPGLFAVRITGSKARLALDILDNDLDGARKAAAEVVKKLGNDAEAFRKKYDIEDGRRAAEQAARQGTAKSITVHSPLKLKSAQ